MSSVLRTLLMASAVAVSASVEALAKDKYDVRIVSETLTAWDPAVHARVVADMKHAQASAGLMPPVKTRHELPRYPKDAKKTDLRGVAKLTARVGTSGKIEAFLTAEGDERLVEAVRGAVEKWRYSPLRLDGVAYETRLSLEVAFGIPEPPPLAFSFQFDSKGVDFDRWVRKFADQIRRNWFPTLARGQYSGRVVLSCRVTREGAVTNVVVVQPSPVEAFNTASLKLIRISSPVAALPATYPLDVLELAVTFTYTNVPLTR